MGEAGHAGAKFRRALDAGNFRAARLFAFELPTLSLADALALTLLAAEADTPHFEPMARRWLSRLLVEVPVPVPTIAVVGQLMADVAEGRLAPSKALVPLERAAEGGRLG